MRNGQKATIVEYKGRITDIYVKFEDGTVVYHESMKCFNSGYIKRYFSRLLLKYLLKEDGLQLKTS